MPINIKIAVPEAEAPSTRSTSTKRSSLQARAPGSWKATLRRITLEEALAEPPCEWIFPECTPQNCHGCGRK